MRLKYGLFEINLLKKRKPKKILVLFSLQRSLKLQLTVGSIKKKIRDRFVLKMLHDTSLCDPN